MKNPVNLTTTTTKGLTAYWKETPCKRNWLRTNAMTYYIIMQLLNIKENWSPLTFRQKISGFSRETSTAHQQFHRKERQLSPSLCLPHTSPSRPLALSSGSPASVWRTDGSKFKTEEILQNHAAAVLRGVLLSQMVLQARHLSVT